MPVGLSESYIEERDRILAEIEAQKMRELGKIAGIP